MKGHAVLITLLLAALPAAAQDRLDGTWRGSSLCTDLHVAPACRDESVVYDFTPRGPGKVHLKADKVVDGARVEMGEFDLEYDAASHAWSAESVTRAGARYRWRFIQAGTVINGELRDLASGTQVRRVRVTRA